MNMDKEELKDLIAGWFGHIEQMATDRKTLNGDVMDHQECLDEIRRLAKDSREFVDRHFETELACDLQRRLHDAQTAMFHSQYPKEFEKILDQTVTVDRKTMSLSELLDTDPFKIVLMVQRDKADFGELTDKFALYARDMAAMRNNHYCNPGESWKEFTRRRSAPAEYAPGDNYSRHEMT